ncbi:small ribosomal subunit Rsm22 family protein [Corticibacterium sp. UT-5YL-CI-8]|nr:small ribosomal subunit Rsm22 family protein [Tianweitania sp. UT-5YL-CI-8]
MELPAALRAAVDAALEGVLLTDLQRAAATLSQRYRAETRDGRLHISDALYARAYLATRLPATFAAVRASLESVAERLPDFAPETLLDAGAGPGTAFWAASDCWPDLAEATLLEASPAIRAVGFELAKASPLTASWRSADLVKDQLPAGRFDLVTIAYVLDELAPERRARLVESLWQATEGVLVVIEPGTPAGWKRILDVRDVVLGQGGYIVAPCPHVSPCPLIEPDWCHFSRRVARSRIHRLTKQGEVPWEDEKYSFVTFSRQPVPTPPEARVLAPPRGGGGLVELKLCLPSGQADERRFSRREGALFKRAKRSDWGDTLDLETP